MRYNVCLKRTLQGFKKTTPHWNIYLDAIEGFVSESKFDIELRSRRSLPLCTPLLSQDTTFKVGQNTKFGRRVSATPLYTTRIPPKLRYELFLKNELAHTLHPIRQIVRVFLATYKSLSPRFDKLFSTAATPEDVENIYEETIVSVKNFLSFVTEFTKLVYPPPTLDDSSEEKSTQADFIDRMINQKICDFIFMETTSPVYSYAFRCLELKKSVELSNFKRLLQDYSHKTLQEIDEQLPDKFLLRGWNEPYRNVAEGISLQKDIANPFTKKEIFTTMEDRIRNTIIAYYLSQGREAPHFIAEPDQKISIYIYALIQSKHERVILDLSFIDEFTGREEDNQSYILFNSCVEFLTNGKFRL